MQALNSERDDDDLRDLLRADGFLRHPTASITHLTGGVSSTVVLITDGERQFVMKRALPKLRVSADWYADVSRNHFESEFLALVAELCPGAVPRILGTGRGYFLMEFCGDGFSNWKGLLFSGVCDFSHSTRAAKVLATIHRMTSCNSEIAERFETGANFHQLRTEPYLLTTASKHRDLEPLFLAQALSLEKTRECLIHGDYSPKNLLMSEDGIMILDAEVACYGDPAFDIAFLLTHLLLKGLHFRSKRPQMALLARGAVNAYFQERRLANFQMRQLDLRSARLLLMLLLARVDGKSPVEYLTESEKQFIRGFVAPALLASESDLFEVIQRWLSAIEGNSKDLK